MANYMMKRKVKDSEISSSDLSKCLLCEFGQEKNTVGSNINADCLKARYLVFEIYQPSRCQFQTTSRVNDFRIAS